MNGDEVINPAPVGQDYVSLLTAEVARMPLTEIPYSPLQ